jgi:peptidylprolyl isomerase
MARRFGRGQAPASVLVALLALLVTAGCSTHGSSSPLPRTTLTTRGPFPEVSGQFGDAPTITFSSGVKPDSRLQRRILRLGKGTPIAIGDLVVTDYVGRIWNGKVFDSSYQAGMATTLQVGIGKLIKGLDAGLVGVPIGSRVELSVPPSDGYGTSGDKSQGISGQDTLLFVLDVAKRYTGKSSADPTGSVTAEPAGLPLVSGPVNQAPLITFGKHLALPAKRSTYVVVRGHGAPLTQGTAIVQYYSTNWLGAFVGSTWLQGTPTSVPVGNATDVTGGVFDGLVGVPVGSRVLIVVPGAPGKGQFASTAVVAVDVLDQLSTAKRMASSS